MFELRGAAVQAGGATILHPLDLDLPGTGLTALIGHNGSGKSTLLRLLAGQHPPSAGTVAFRGRPLAAWPRRELARHLAFMPQDPAIDPALPVQDLVAAGRFPWHGTFGRVTPADRAAIADAMRRTATTAFAARPVGSLSGGERQRAVLALCLAQSADCLLLDEPTAALDIRHQVATLQLLHGLTRGPVGAIVVLHDINLASRFADTVVALGAGRVIAAGTPAALIRPDTLERIYGTPIGTIPHPAGHAPIAFLP